MGGDPKLLIAFGPVPEDDGPVYGYQGLSCCVGTRALWYQGTWVPGHLNREGVLTTFSDKSNITIDK